MGVLRGRFPLFARASIGRPVMETWRAFLCKRDARDISAFLYTRAECSKDVVQSGDERYERC